MKLLLDTHVLLWLAHEPNKLSALVRDAIESGDHAILVSAVSAMEIATKHRNEKLEYRTSLATHFTREVESQGFTPLAISCEHAQWAGNITSLHKDPWDRLLAAQAQLDKLAVVTVDKFFAEIGVTTFW